MFVEVKVGALIMDPNSNTPIVVLKGVDGEAILPIWVGAYEANAIALEIEKIVSPRPMTHDLLRNIITELKCQVEKILVSDLLDNTFYAIIEIKDIEGNIISIDARPSDAIALALRTDCPIFVAKKVLDISNASTSLQPKLDEEFEETQKPLEEWPDLIG
ncbi:MAG: bifunctional nuclease family protein [Pyrinomonadaceae bacterium]|nr:bifunctional nuclease family protein [Pyrinomonadaceae bacterium]